MYEFRRITLTILSDVYSPSIECVESLRTSERLENGNAKMEESEKFGNGFDNSKGIWNRCMQRCT